MTQMAFEFEFYSEELPNLQLEDDMRAEAGSRLRELAMGQSDMVGASVAIEKPTHGETDYLYQARVVAYIRPENIVAVEKEDGPMSALQAALDAVERQVRARRERFQKPWEQP
jgi:ribosome-associated translation inhibitor RaiA